MKKAKNKALFAYLAGLIDGEGTIRIGYGSSTKYYASISIGMTNKKVLHMFVKVFGSRVYEEVITIQGRKRMYRWGTSGNKTVPNILQQLLPYLRVKRKQARLVIKFCRICDQLRAKKSPIRKCLECGHVKRISAYGLCKACDMRRRRAGREVEKIKNIHFISPTELKHRRNFYELVRKLNAVGVSTE